MLDIRNKLEIQDFIRELEENKLNEKVFIYVINGNEVSENEFKNYVLNGGKIRNEKNTKENNI